MNRHCLRSAARTLVLGLLAAVVAYPSAAATEFQWNDPHLSSQAKALANGAKLQVRGLALFPGEATTALDLQRFRVWKPGAMITVEGPRGLRRHPLPERTLFRGNLVGEDESLVFASIDGNNAWRSLVIARERLFVVTADSALLQEGGDPQVREVDLASDLAQVVADWSCATDSLGSIPASLKALPSRLGADLSKLAATSFTVPPGVGGPTLAGDLAVDTDWEFFDLFGSESEAAGYVTDLVGAISAIFLRDINTAVQISDLFLYTRGAQQDPWQAGNVVEAVFEVRDYWLRNRAHIDRSLVHFLTGKSLGGGVAFVETLCDTAMGYGVSAGITGSFDPQNPTVVWDIVVVAHELGHTFGSPHTHCYGDFPTAGDPPIDMCYGSEMGCYAGTTSTPDTGGSLMSYCHLRPGGISNMRLWLGRKGFYGTQSERINTRMRSYIESVSSCLPEVVNEVFSDGFESGDTSSWTLSSGSG